MRLGLTIGIIVTAVLILFASDYLIIKALAQEESKSKSNEDEDEGGNLLSDLAVPLAVAAIGGIAASWTFIQAKWNGRYFQDIILRELGELEPSNMEKTNGNLKNHMKKRLCIRRC